ncbi:MAG TPA: hypothetical protein VJ719_15135 [Chthoniobacterales bacterium]|nr:hypothetical protein [Chthoniobacterales bacterium]
MKIKIALLLCAALPGAALAAPPALTIYNQNFAVVRDTVPLDLKAGVTEVRFSETTAHVETDSVILRDPAGKINLQILEQNYRNDPVSQELLLSLFEGKTIEFLVTEPNQPSKIVSGKIIRSGYVAHNQMAMRRYGQAYAMAQSSMAYGAGGSSQPIIEVDGKLRFSLPGQPLFPALTGDTILKPTINWQIQADKAGKLDAELAYVTGGMSWEADYNVIAPENTDQVDVIGWITMDNQSGKTFDNAKIKLMAGDVSKIQPAQAYDMAREEMAVQMRAAAAPAVTEKAFEDYHLYSLARPTTLHDRETKQVEFVRASKVQSQKVYVYDGLKIDWNQYRGYRMENMRNNQDLGIEMDTKVAIMREFKNSEANHLGMPLPKGRVRFYKQDADKQLEFTGENTINHTPKDEMIRIYTGNAFDLVGERRRTNIKVDSNNHWLDESFEIKLRNHKKEPVEIKVVEHLFRWFTWDITQKSDPFTKTNAQTMEFRVPVKPDEEKTITYTVHYSW